MKLSQFIKLLKDNNVRSFLEIGSKKGGSFGPIVRSLPKHSRAVSVDLPFPATAYQQYLPLLKECVHDLERAGYDVHLILGDSTDEKTIERVRALGPFDACFIDANHYEDYVRKDWANYGPMSKIVAFHDINDTVPRENFKIEVKKVWDELKLSYQHCEIKHEANVNGIGVLWR
jgi:hypothetical protein